jgi:glucokinase
LLAIAYDPQRRVLGGGLAQAAGPLIPTIQGELARWAERAPLFREIYAPEQVRLTALKGEAGILGAAALVARHRPGGTQ